MEWIGISIWASIVLTLWWPKTTRNGVIAGMIVGFSTTIIWSNYAVLNIIISERVTSFIFSIISIYCVSIFSKNEN